MTKRESINQAIENYSLMLLMAIEEMMQTSTRARHEPTEANKQNSEEAIKALDGTFRFVLGKIYDDGFKAGREGEEA